MKAANLVVIFSQLIYLPVAFACIYLFGNKIEINFFTNLGSVVEVTWHTYVLRCIFIVIIACHVPYVFFAGKESFLVLIEETTNKTISSALATGTQIKGSQIRASTK